MQGETRGERGGRAAGEVRRSLGGDYGCDAPRGGYLFFTQKMFPAYNSPMKSLTCMTSMFLN